MIVEILLTPSFVRLTLDSTPTGNAGVYRGPGNGQGRPTVGARQVVGASFRRGGYLVGRTPSGSGRP